MNTGKKIVIHPTFHFPVHISDIALRNMLWFINGRRRWIFPLSQREVLHSHTCIASTHLNIYVYNLSISSTKTPQFHNNKTQSSLLNAVINSHTFTQDMSCFSRAYRTNILLISKYEQFHAYKKGLCQRKHLAESHLLQSHFIHGVDMIMYFVSVICVHQCQGSGREETCYRITYTLQRGPAVM